MKRLLHIFQSLANVIKIEIAVSMKSKNIFQTCRIFSSVIPYVISLPSSSFSSSLTFSFSSSLFVFPFFSPFFLFFFAFTHGCQTQLLGPNKAFLRWVMLRQLGASCFQGYFSWKKKCMLRMKEDVWYT